MCADIIMLSDPLGHLIFALLQSGQNQPESQISNRTAPPDLLPTA